MKKIISRFTTIIVFMFSLNFSVAQIGRHEEPSDTMEIGGEEQKKKTIQIEGREMVLKEAKALSDSVASTLTEIKNQSANILDVDKQRYDQAKRELTQHKKQLTDMINLLNSEKWNAEMTEQSYKTLKEVRKEYNRLRNDVRH